MRIVATCLLFLFFAVQSAMGDEIVLHFGPNAIHAELATTPQQWDLGLMHRNHLCADCGMLFVFPSAARYSFWMKDTPLPLSIAFIAADGSVINIAEMQPQTTEEHDAEGDALYALEMNRNWFTRHGVKRGDRLMDVKSLPRTRQ